MVFCSTKPSAHGVFQGHALPITLEFEWPERNHPLLKAKPLITYNNAVSEDLYRHVIPHTVTLTGLATLERD